MRSPTWKTCPGCPHRPKCRPVPACGPAKHPTLALIGESPGREENRLGTPFAESGRSGNLLRESLKWAGHDPASCLFENAIRAPFQKSAVLATRCVENAKREVKRRRPKLVVLLGKTALEAWYGRKASITFWEGVLVEPGVAALRHPAFVMRRLGVEPHWSQLIKNLFLLNYRPSVEFEEVKNRKAFKRLCSSMRGEVSLDYECTGLSPLTEDLLTVGLCWKKGTYVARADAVDLKALGGLFRRPKKVRMIAQNVAFEAAWTRRLCGFWPDFHLDTMIRAHLIDENAPKRLTHLVRRWLPDLAGYDLGVYEQVKTEKRAERKSYAEVPLEDLMPYNAGDAVAAWRLGDVLGAQSYRPHRALEDLLVTASLVLAKVEYDGFRVSLEKAEAAEKQLIRNYGQVLRLLRSHRIVRAFERDRDVKLNPRSTPQVQELLFDRRYVGLRVTKRTATGKPSTDADSLKEAVHPVAEKIVETRSILHRISGFIKPLPALAAHDGRVHPSYLVTGTVSGQISCSGPNITGVKDEPLIKGLFVPERPGGAILEADYSQLEIGLLAMRSNDKELIEAFTSGADMHHNTACEMYETDEPTNEQREVAKRVNYGVSFGEGPSKLARDHHISMAEAKRRIDGWFDRHAGVRRFVARRRAELQEEGYVESVWKQRRRLPAVYSHDHGDVEEALRQGVNFDIQNADRLLTLWGMCRADRYFRQRPGLARIVVEMHDSVGADVARKSLLRKAAAVLYKAMVIDPFKELDWMTFPMRVDFHWGDDWSCPNELKVDGRLKRQAARCVLKAEA